MCRINGEIHPLRCSKMTLQLCFRKYSHDAAPRVPVLKLSMNRTVFCSKGTVVPPEVINTNGRSECGEDWWSEIKVAAACLICSISEGGADSSRKRVISAERADLSGTVPDSEIESIHGESIVKGQIV